MYGCGSWSIKKDEHRRIDAFELWCWRRLLRVPWKARGSNQSILKEISPEYSLEGLRLKLKLQYFGHLMHKLTHWKRPWCWERLKVGTEGVDRGWDGWMASLTWWTWVWVNSELVMDRESWHPTVYGVAKSWTRLSHWTELISTVIQSFSLLRSLSNIYWPHTGCYATRKVHSCDFTKMHRRNHLPEKTMLLFEI